MDWQGLAIFFTALAGFGTGIYSFVKQQTDRQDALRVQLQAQMQSQIDKLNLIVSGQNRIIEHQDRTIDAQNNHINELKMIMVKAGLEVPMFHAPVREISKNED